MGLMSRKAIVVAIALFVASLHFVTGPGYRGPAREFVNGYLIDLLLPFAMFLVSGVAAHSVLRSPLLRAVAVFSVGAFAETLQAFDVEVLGSTFDPLDYLMYALGVLGGVAFERIALSRLPIRLTVPPPER
jgi:hypothetical protein